MANKVFCIGNGESRQSIDLNKLRSHGKIYGCNALYRDFTPDVLVAVDADIIQEIYDSGYSQKNETWFRNWKQIDDNTHCIDNLILGEKDRGYGAGASSGKIALTQNLDVKELYLIGHDLKSNTNFVNNIYKGTSCYRDVKATPVPPVNWITQWKTLFCEYPFVQFYKVNPEGQDTISLPVPEWNDVMNLKYISIQTTLDKFGIS